MRISDLETAASRIFVTASGWCSRGSLPDNRKWWRPAAAPSRMPRPAHGSLSRESRYGYSGIGLALARGFHSERICLVASGHRERQLYCPLVLSVWDGPAGNPKGRSEDARSSGRKIIIGYLCPMLPFLGLGIILIGENHLPCLLLDGQPVLVIRSSTKRQDKADKCADPVAGVHQDRHGRHAP